MNRHVIDKLLKDLYNCMLNMNVYNSLNTSEMYIKSVGNLDSFLGINQYFGLNDREKTYLYLVINVHINLS